MKMVEKAAKAIYDAPTTFDGDTIATHLSQSMMIDGSATNADELRKIVRSVCRDAAIAVLKAMREPTQSMIDAMDEYAGTIAPEHAYEAAIDQAIAEAALEAQKEEER